MGSNMRMYVVVSADLGAVPVCVHPTTVAALR